MEYRTLGKTGLRVSRMGFGGIPIQKTDREAMRRLAEAMLAAGVNYIDTAKAYTVSEEWIGCGIAGLREHFILATKSMARTKEAMARDIDDSLKKLGTDYIDLYQVHNPNAEQFEAVTAPGGALEALVEAKKAGKIGHIGVTLHSAEVFARALESDWAETIMFPYNIVETQGTELIRRCEEKQIGFIAMKPLAGGAIGNARLALRWICADPAVTVVIPGMAEERELAENLAACGDPAPLSEEEQAEVREIREQLGSSFCRRCNYCAPCQAGIQIPNVFLFAGYLQRYDLEKWARERYATLKVKASACVGCGGCETRCPYHLPIREMLKQAAADFGE